MRGKNYLFTIQLHLVWVGGGRGLMVVRGFQTHNEPIKQKRRVKGKYIS